MPQGRAWGARYELRREECHIVVDEIRALGVRVERRQQLLVEAVETVIGVLEKRLETRIAQLAPVRGRGFEHTIGHEQQPIARRHLEPVSGEHRRQAGAKRQVGMTTPVGATAPSRRDHRRSLAR